MEQAEKAGIPRMKELVGILKRADTAYYKHDDPIMTDREYDALFDELKMLEDNSGIVLSGSPTQKVSGEILEGLTEVEHTRPMLSAAKTKISAISERLKELRKEVKLCDGIAKRSGVIADTLSQVKAEEEKSQRKESRNYEQRR